MKWLDDMKVGRRLTVAFGGVGLLMVTLGVGALWSQRVMNGTVNQVLLELTQSNLSAEFTSQVSASRMLLPTIILSKDSDSKAEQLARNGGTIAHRTFRTLPRQHPAWGKPSSSRLSWGDCCPPRSSA